MTYLQLLSFKKDNCFDNDLLGDCDYVSEIYWGYENQTSEVKCGNRR